MTLLFLWTSANFFFFKLRWLFVCRRWWRWRRINFIGSLSFSAQTSQREVSHFSQTPSSRLYAGLCLMVTFLQFYTLCLVAKIWLVKRLVFCVCTFGVSKLGWIYRLARWICFRFLFTNYVFLLTLWSVVFFFSLNDLFVICF